VPNIERERFLPDPAMLALITTVRVNAASALSLLRTEYVHECRKFVLEGGEVQFSAVGTQLGRAVDKQIFIDFLSQNFPSIFSSRKSAERFVNRLLIPTTRISNHEARAFMSSHAVWVTWNATNNSGDPFEFAKHARADEVRANLGLKSARKGRSPHILLLCYKCNGNLKIYRPTVADAELYEFFEPPTDGEHGWTVPWPPEEISHLPAGAELAPRPEGLHRKLTIDILDIPIREFT
jgi:hypothetical protein